jgi:hypothetical protein
VFENEFDIDAKTLKRRDSRTSIVSLTHYEVDANNEVTKASVKSGVTRRDSRIRQAPKGFAKREATEDDVASSGPAIFKTGVTVVVRPGVILVKKEKNQKEIQQIEELMKKDQSKLKKDQVAKVARYEELLAENTTVDPVEYPNGRKGVISDEKSWKKEYKVRFDPDEKTQFTHTGTAASGSKAVTMHSTGSGDNAIAIGQMVTGAGIPAGSTVAKIEGTILTLSIATNAEFTKATMTFGEKPLESDYILYDEKEKFTKATMTFGAKPLESDYADGDLLDVKDRVFKVYVEPVKFKKKRMSRREQVVKGAAAILTDRATAQPLLVSFTHSHTHARTHTRTRSFWRVRAHLADLPAFLRPV